MKRTVILAILDGWGIGRDDETNPIYMVKPPTLTKLAEEYPLTSLQASGISVGLPWGEVGNSEVGHLTLGAGKVLYQYFPKITMAIQDGTFFDNETLKKAFAHAKENNSTLNLVGLLSKGNVHASMEHLSALIKMAGKEGVENFKLHLFSDGKDMPPKTLKTLLASLPAPKIATLVGRYYAMDREENWSLTAEAYKLLTEKGPVVADVNTIIDSNEARGLTEEFLPPVRLREDSAISDNDSILFFNFREDSIRQIAEAFIAKEFEAFPRKDLQNVFVATMTHYKDTWEAPAAFMSDKVVTPFGKVLSDNGLVQLRLAETYKYAHVSYFFNGYIEEKFPNEYRVLIPSDPVPHPDQHPEMMATALTDRLIGAIEERMYDFILINYANPDTIAHTGNYHATEKAILIVDTEIRRVMSAVEATDAILLITADHGNAEELINPMTGRMETQHDPSPVPFYLIAKEYKGRRFSNWPRIKDETIGILSDVAPTILALMNLPKPEDMTGEDLLRNLV